MARERERALAAGGSQPRDGAAWITGMMCVGDRVAAMCARGSGPRDQRPRPEGKDETCGDRTNY